MLLRLWTIQCTGNGHSSNGTSSDTLRRPGRGSPQASLKYENMRWPTLHLSPLYRRLVTELIFEDIHVKSRAHSNFKVSLIVQRYCEYGEVFSDMLHDCVVRGINNKAVQRHLLQEPLRKT